MSTSPKALRPKDLITGSTRTSSLPEIFIMINEVVNDPTSSFSDIAQVVNLDTALSARLLKIVNSSFYSFPSNIEPLPLRHDRILKLRVRFPTQVRQSYFGA